MNRNYAIPTAALALATATACADPIVSDWGLTKLVENGFVFELDGPDASNDTGYSNPRFSYKGSLNIDEEYDTTLEMSRTVSYKDGNGEVITNQYAETYMGEAIPGVGEFAGTYLIELGESLAFECDVKDDPTRLVCDEFDGARLLVFEPSDVDRR